MEQLFREFGTAGLAIVGAVAVMGFVWGAMYGNDIVTYKTRDADGNTTGTSYVSSADKEDAVGSIRYDQYGKAHRSGINANEETKSMTDTGYDPGYKQLGDFLSSISMD